MGDERALAEKLGWAFSHREQMRAMGQAARQAFEEKYSAERNGELLEAIYRKAMES